MLFLHLKKLESPSSKNASCWDWLKFAHWFWRRRFFNFENVISRFRNYLAFEKGGALHLNKLVSPSHKDALCQVWLKFTQQFWRRRFLNFVHVFSQFLNYLPLGRVGSFFWTNLNPLHPRMLCVKFGWNWPSGSEEDENVKSLRQRQQQQRRLTTDKFWSEKLTWAFGSGELNKRPMGHIAHLRKQFKSINTYDYIITLI